MRFVVSVINVVDRLVKRVGELSSLLILLLVLVTVFDVVTRKFTFIQQLILESPLHNVLSPTKLQELEWHFHAAIFLLTFGYAYLSNTHVRVDLVRETLAPRKQMLTELFGLVFLALPFVSVLIYYAWIFVLTSYEQQEMSASMNGLPYRWIIKSVFLAGIVLLALAIVSTIVRLLIILCCRADSLDKALATGGTTLDGLHVLSDKQEEEILEVAITTGAAPELDKKPGNN